ncbi:hypothetical protein HGM15179_013797 [Zosterops borbonicus]|uniref:Uncharacterized protein n=1 Tax=Zosterops borbonicus TaxID=364589 RepID=A0A8K1LGT4_9PASS|nr:hypothetical protein HGM15179_013797 [Zosterops borbonicus]
MALVKALSSEIDPRNDGSAEGLKSAWATIGFLGQRALLAHGQLAVHQEPQVLLHRAAFEQAIKVLLKDPFRSTALWDVGHSSQIYVISKIAEEASAPSSKPSMNKFNNSGPSIEHWGSPLLTSIRLNPVPLIATLWDLLFIQFSIHSLFTHPVLPDFAYKDIVRDNVESPAEVEVDDIHCSLPSSIHVVVSSYKVI